MSNTFHCAICSSCINLYVCALKDSLIYCEYGSEPDYSNYNTCKYPDSGCCVNSGEKVNPYSLCSKYENLMEVFDNAK